MFNICIIKPKNYVHYLAFKEVSELLHFSFLKLNLRSSITFNNFDTNPRKKNIIFGAHLLNEELINSVPKNSIIFNTEQVGSLNLNKKWVSRIMQLAENGVELWDYSIFNLKYIYKFTKVEGKLFEIGYQDELNRIRLSKSPDIDVLFYGAINERRKHIIDKLVESKIKVKCLFGEYGEKRDKWIANSKLVLNMHMYDSKVFEIIRVFYLMTNSVPVVSEYDKNTKINYNYLNGFKASSYDELIKNIINLVGNKIARKELGNKGSSLIKKYPQEEFTKKILNL